MTAEDQKLAVRWIRDVTIISTQSYQPAPWVGLPSVARRFDNLRRFTFWIAYRTEWMPERERIAFMAGEEIKTDFPSNYIRERPPREEMGALRVMMRKMGFPACVEFGVMCAGTEWVWMRECYLRNKVYPMMEVKARLVEGKKGKGGA